jgi:hypothetical protein
MRRRNIKPIFTAVEKELEPHVNEIKFKVHKFNNRPKPNRRNIVIFPCFSEFGTEVLGTLYCIPRLMQSKYMGKYSIVVGWHGRKFLYKNIVDEFWELGEEHQWLRKYCRAFHHDSKNLYRIERNICKMGHLVSPLELGTTATYPKLEKCLVSGCTGGIISNTAGQKCDKCEAIFPAIGLFENPIYYKKDARWPVINEEKKVYYNKYIKPNSVGITARNRDAYGRNLPVDFYKRLISLLENKGYNPVWIGEKETILPCPYPHIQDFSITDDAKDLENTLALVSQLKFTIQFWTASTRLAGLVGTPYILFESPDQIYGGDLTPGHEGFRSYLCTKGNKKLVMAHYNSVVENYDAAFQLVERAIIELESGNYSDIAGMVADEKHWLNWSKHESS